MAKRGPKLGKCHDCGINEGEIHVLGCDMESCSYCGGQLISCGCAYEVLGLRNPELWGAETGHLPPDIYENGLSEEQGATWEKMLEDKGRLPYIVYPNLCVRCGRLWPEMFSVPDAEWERYIEIRERDKMLCLPCYETIKALIERGKP